MESLKATILGTTKESFEARSVFPATQDDKFINDKCAICWGPYDEDHPAVRYLPCNHILGRPCLLDHITTAPNGDVCSICRTPILRPSIFKIAKRWVNDAAVRLGVALLTMCVRLVSIYHSLHWSIKLPLRIVLMVAYLPLLIKDPVVLPLRFLGTFTHFGSRNPHIRTRDQLVWATSPATLVQKFLTCFKKFRVCTSGYNIDKKLSLDQIFGRGLIRRGAFKAVIKMVPGVLREPFLDLARARDPYSLRPLWTDNAIVSALGIVLTAVNIGFAWYCIRGRMHSRKDKWLLGLAMAWTGILAHFYDIWIVACFLQGLNPYSSWLGEWLVLWGAYGVAYSVGEGMVDS